MSDATRIRSLAAALPDNGWDVESKAGRADISRLTGIRRRRECTAGQDSLSLAVAAGRRCLQQADCNPDAVERLVYAGITRFTPGKEHFRFTQNLSASVADALGCRRAEVTDLSNACAGMLTAWYLGNLELPRGEASRTLIVSGEHLSPIARNAEGVVDDWRHPELASLTVGDAGAALLIDAEGAGPGLRGAHFETFHAHAELCIAGAHPSGPGGRMVTDAVAIHAEAIRALPGVAEKALDEAGLNYGDITRVVPHQTSARAIELAKRRFADVFAPGDPPWEVSLAETGNTGSTSHILALTQLAERGELREGDHLLFISSASGLVVAALVYTWDGETRVGVERC